MSDSAFKVIFREENDPSAGKPLNWEPACPLMVEATQISRNTSTGDAFLQLRLLNICGEEVSTFELSCTCTYEDGSEETLTINPLDADIPAGGEYVPEALKLSKGTATGAVAHLVSVKTPTAEWTSADASAQLPPAQALDLFSSTSK